MSAADPYLRAQTTLGNRIVRTIWGIAYILLFRVTPRPLHAWRACVLRCFGARIGKDTRIYPDCRIWAPWNLRCDDVATIGSEAEIYNVALVHLQHHAIVSQQAYLCGAAHDLDDPAFPMVAAPIVLGPYSWVCARASVQAGVSLGEGAVLALGSVATTDLAPWTIHGGIPARAIKPRPRAAQGSNP
jgi:putative colanic acid biosynthesis acetyltransferase WcaF